MKLKRRSASIFVLFILFLTLIPVSQFGFPTVEAASGWWDWDWDRRIEIDITGSTVGALTNYPMQFTLLFPDGDNDDNNIYTAGDAQSDYRDIRFIADDQTTVLPHWMQDNMSHIDPNATVWVKIPSIPASPNEVKIWAYWGNPSAPSTSDGSAVFPFFDDFDTDPATNPDWTIVGGAVPPSGILHEDWRISIIESSDNGGWAYLKGDEDLVLAGSSTDYGWSMEWDGTTFHDGGNDNFPFYGAGLANNLEHIHLSIDNLTSGVNFYWRSANPIANRAFVYNEFDSIDNIVQSNGTATPWVYGTNAAAPVGWTRYQIALFSDTSYVSVNGTKYRTLSGLSSNYLTEGLDPSFSAGGKSGDSAIIRGYVNWVFMRALADPEPTAEVAEVLTLDADAEFTNLEDCDYVYSKEIFYIAEVNVTNPFGYVNVETTSIAFSDGSNWINASYHQTANTFVLDSGSDQVTLASGGVTGSGTVLSVNFAFFFSDKIRDALDADLYVYANDTTNGLVFDWTLVAEDHFNIYNTGKMVDYTFGIGDVWFGDWENRFEIVIDSSDVSSSLTNFPLLLTLGTSVGIDGDDVSAIFDELASDGNRKKIAFVSTDGETQYYGEIEEWDDASEDASIWVRVPSISSSVDTTFYMYFDSSKPDNTVYVGDIGDTPSSLIFPASEYILVYHMVDLTTSTVEDSTANDNDGDKLGANEPNEVDGQIAQAQDLDGANDIIDTDALLNFGAGDYTIEAFIYPSGTADDPIISNWAPADTSWDLRFGGAGGDNQKLTWISSEDGTAGGEAAVQHPSVMDQNTWQYVAVTRRGTNLYMYVNQTEHDAGADSKTLFTSSTAHLIGKFSGYDAWFDGIIDEVRIQTVSRTGSWLNATYETQTDDFNGWESVEDFASYTPPTGSDGAKVTGGNPFDVEATNGTLGSWARADMYVINFQHMNTLVHLVQDATWNATGEYWDCISEHDETGYLEYGIDFCDGTGYVESFKVRIQPTNGSAGTLGATNDDAYAYLDVSWYNRGDLVKTDSIVVMYEAYKAQDSTTQFSLWIDLWLSDLQGSSTVAGRVSAQYYGMTGSGWGPWADWGPVDGTSTSSVFMGDLLDEDKDSIGASSLSLFRVWSRVGKSGAGEGTDCDLDKWETSHEVGPNVRRLSRTSTLVGLEGVVLQPTTTPDMPLGFFPSIGSRISATTDAVGEWIMNTAVGGVTYVYNLATDTIDSVFDAGLGVPNFTTTIGSLASGFGLWVSDSAGYAVSIITLVFGVFTATASFIITWVGNVFSVILQIGAIVQAVIDGTYVGLGALTDIWALIEIAAWASVLPLFMVIWWFDSIDKRGRRSGSWMGTFYGDVSMIMSVFAYIFSMSMQVISLIIDWAARFATFLLPL